jgi:hypothetical protein
VNYVESIKLTPEEAKQRSTEQLDDRDRPGADERGAEGAVGAELELGARQLLGFGRWEGRGTGGPGGDGDVVTVAQHHPGGGSANGMTQRRRDRVQSGLQVGLRFGGAEGVVEARHRGSGAATFGRQTAGDQGEERSEDGERDQRGPVDAARFGRDHVRHRRPGRRRNRQAQAEPEPADVGRERDHEEKEHEAGVERARDRDDDDLDHGQAEERREDASRETGAARRDGVEERRAEHVDDPRRAQRETLGAGEPGRERDAHRDGETEPQPQVPGRPPRRGRGHAAPCPTRPRAAAAVRTPRRGQ